MGDDDLRSFDHLNQAMLTHATAGVIFPPSSTPPPDHMEDLRAASETTLPVSTLGSADSNYTEIKTSFDFDIQKNKRKSYPLGDSPEQTAKRDKFTDPQRGYAASFIPRTYHPSNMVAFREKVSYHSCICTLFAEGLVVSWTASMLTVSNPTAKTISI